MYLSFYVPTDHPIVDEVLEMFDLKPGELLYDIGCGDARVLIAAAEEYGVKGIGIEINPIHVEIAKYSVKESGLEDQIEIIEADVLDESVDISAADAVYMYLDYIGIDELRPKLERQLRPDCRVISKGSSVIPWRPTGTIRAFGDSLFLYEMDSIYPKRS